MLGDTHEMRCTTAADDQHFAISAEGQVLKRALRKEGFKALGTKITFDNAFESELYARIAKAWRAFFKYKDLLCCRDCTIHKRLKLLGCLVENALFWCAGSWNLTQAQLSKLRGVQQTMIRKMLCIKPTPTEDVASYCIRCAHMVRNTMHRCRVEGWDAHYHRLLFYWAGHVHRIGVYDPDRLTYQVLKYKDMNWICLVASQNSGNQLHCRRLRTWRWERPLFKYFEDRPCTWQESAADKEQWLQQVNAMVSWRCTYR